MVHFNNQQQPKAARITSMEFINGHDDALLLIGTDDGSCRIWRDFIRNGSSRSSAVSPVEEPLGATLVSAWNCIAEMTPSTRCSGLVLDWNQDSLKLLATGDVTWREHAAWVIDCEWISVDPGVSLVSGRCAYFLNSCPSGLNFSNYLFMLLQFGWRYKVHGP